MLSKFQLSSSIVSLIFGPKHINRTVINERTVVDNTLSTIAFLSRFSDWPLPDDLQISDMRQVIIELIKHRVLQRKPETLDDAFCSILSIELRLLLDQTSELEPDIATLKLFLGLNRGDIPKVCYHELLLRLADAEAEYFIRVRRPLTAIECLERCMLHDCKKLEMAKNVYHVGATQNRDISEKVLLERVSHLKRNQCIDDVAKLYDAKKFSEIVELLEPSIIESGDNPFSEPGSYKLLNKMVWFEYNFNFRSSIEI